MSATQLYEGKAKILYTTDDPQVLRSYFKDDATAFNAQKRGQIAGKGEVNCTVATALFKVLAQAHIPSHFLSQLSPQEMLVKAVQIVPLEVVVRNIAAGSLCRQTGLPIGKKLPKPLVEFYLKDDALGDPLLTRDRIALLEIVTAEQLQTLETLALRINQALQVFFQACDITLVDFKLEFGHEAEGALVLADEISPDTCRLWDDKVSDPKDRVLDKDRFRQDLGNIAPAYQEVQRRVLAQLAQLGLA
ncbi:MAG: phosphoribosylaminoimidazolesuccinocarboxamide synthase [Cyanobacteria bacterium P01_H01_bin.15]